MPGTYKINSKLISGINICEFYDMKNSSEFIKLYDGYVEINDVNEITLIPYFLTGEILQNDFYTDYFLPNEKFSETWSKIIYDEGFKYDLFENIVKYYKIDQKVCNLMGINKCILIHGNPGVGKTTMSKALCQKLAIRTQKNIILREINCNKLFSRFYGESIKNLYKAIETGNEDTIFLFDEADSLLIARNSIITKNEPNDSLRIINTLLGIIDKGDNLFILISNYKDVLEPAILDRCDMIVEIKFLTIETTYKLIKDTLERPMELNFIEYHQFLEVESPNDTIEDESSLNLLNISKRVLNQSPRKIKKIIFESSAGQKENVNIVLNKIIKKLK